MENFHSLLLITLAIFTELLTVLCLAIWIWVLAVRLLYKIKKGHYSDTHVGRYLHKWGRRWLLKSLASKYGRGSMPSLVLCALSATALFLNVSIIQQFTQGCASARYSHACYDMNHINNGWSGVWLVLLGFLFFFGVLGTAYVRSLIKK